MLSFYSMLARKPWGRPENTKGTMGMHQKFRAQQPTFLTDRADHWSLLFTGREHLGHSQCASVNAFVAYFVFMRSHFRTQGKLTTDCDGSVKHGKWQEPAGTLSVALTAYTRNSGEICPVWCSTTRKSRNETLCVPPASNKVLWLYVQVLHPEQFAWAKNKAKFVCQFRQQGQCNYFFWGSGLQKVTVTWEPPQTCFLFSGCVWLCICLPFLCFA